MTLIHFANGSSNFYRESKSAKFGLDFQNQSPLKGSSFETEQHFGNLKDVAEAYMIALNTDLEIRPTPPLIYTQDVKKCKIKPFRRCGFETKQRIAYLLSVILHLTRSGCSKLLSIRDLILHQTAAFEDNRHMFG